MVFLFSAASTQHKEQNVRPTAQQHAQNPVYQRSAGGDHVNGPDLLSSAQSSDVLSKVDIPTSYHGAAAYGAQSSLEQQPVQQQVQQQKMAQQQQPMSQQHQQYASGRGSNSSANQMASNLSSRTASSGKDIEKFIIRGEIA